MNSSKFNLMGFLTILLTVTISEYCAGEDCQTIEQAKNSPAAVVDGVVITEEPGNTPVINEVVMDFNYREFILNKHRSEPARRTLRNVNENQPHRDDEVFIDFDDHEVGSNWGRIEVLHDFYEDLGVNFRGNNDVDGGGIIDEDGNFGVNGHSSPNFLAYNTGSRFPNGGVPRPPQFIIFDSPVDVVSILAGARNNGIVTMTAFNTDDEEIADTEINTQAQMQEMSVEQSGIAYVVINTQLAVFVLDDLYFANLAELEIVPEAFDLVVPINQVQEEALTVGNVGEGNLVFNIEDEGDDPDWLSFDPEEGEVEPENETEVTVIISTEDLEPRQYDRMILFHCNDPARNLVEIPVHMFASAGEGSLNGTVTDAATDRPVEGVHLSLDGFDYVTFTNADGEFDFGAVPAWNYTLVAVMDDYLVQSIEDVEVEVGGRTTIEVGLFHADFDPDPAQIEIAIPTDDALETPLVIRNPGNGPLTWTVDRVFPGGGEIDPWVYREFFAAGDSVEDNRMGGIEFVGDNFYIAGGNSGADQNFVYIFDREGNYIDQFVQFEESRYGMRDLAWDGELLWGIDGNTVYGFTTDGQLSFELESPVRSARSIAYDRDRELLWVCSVTTDIIGIDRDGNQQAEIDRPEDTHIYGMAYFPEAPDGFSLYLFTSDGDWRQQVHKVDPQSSESQLVGDLTDIEGARAGGLCISGVWDPYSWAFISMLDSPDIVGIWQLAPRTDWLQIDPVASVVEPDSEVEMTVFLNTLGLPEDEVFEVDLVFTHDGVGGMTVVHVAIQITGEGGLSQRTLGFELGWNLASLNVDPPNNSIVNIMQPLVDEDLLILMKDAEGRFYNPEFGFNNIPFWNVTEGYQVKVAEGCQLTVEGEVVAWDTPIDLSEGWQMVSYYPRQPVDAILGFSDVVDNLLIAKDNWGNFYNPEFGFSNIGDLREGQGYQLKMAADDQMVYTLGEGALAAISPSQSGRADIPACPGRVRRHFGTVTPTGSNMSLLLMMGSPLSPPLTRGIDGMIELAAFSQDGLLVGSGVFDSDGRCGVAIWGDDPTTDEIDGAVENEPVGFRLWNETSEMELQANWTQGDGCYRTDDLAVVTLNSQSPIATEFRLEKPYPNPFNNLVRLQFSLKDETTVRLVIYAISGREVAEVVNSKLTTGTHSVYWDASGFPSGIYLARLSIPEAMQTVKMTLIK